MEKFVCFEVSGCMYEDRDTIIRCEDQEATFYTLYGYLPINSAGVSLAVAIGNFNTRQSAEKMKERLGPANPFTYGEAETIADIAFMAGQKQFYGGDARADIERFILWAKEFDKKFNEDLESGENQEDDYLEKIEKFTQDKISEVDARLNPFNQF